MDKKANSIGYHRYEVAGDDKLPIYVHHLFPTDMPAERVEELVDGFKLSASMVRGHSYALTAYDLWRPTPWKNPGNRAAGAIGGTTAVANMIRAQRRARARKGGNAVFHGDAEGGDGVRASARGRLLARKRWQTQ
jgi:hypothetical protein